jgi:hypothetical protein
VTGAPKRQKNSAADEPDRRAGKDVTPVIGGKTFTIRKGTVAVKPAKNAANRSCRFWQSG